jgi:hypothetical protein
MRKSLPESYNRWGKDVLREVDRIDLIGVDQNIPYSRTIPIKTVSEANSSEHWTKRSKRHSMQKLAVLSFLRADSPQIKLPCTITLTRIAPRKFDSSDNLPASFKYIKDAVAEYIHPGKAPGRADDDERITWQYSQEKGAVREYAIRIVSIYLIDL